MNAGASATSQAVKRRNLAGIAAILLAVACFAGMDTGIKLLAQNYPAAQVAAMRSVLCLPLILAYAVARRRAHTLFRVRWRLQVLRGVLGATSLAAFAYGLARIGLAEAYSIFFVAPLLIAVLSTLFLKESVGAAGWAAIGIGLFGTLLALRPNGEEFASLGGLAILLAASCYALVAVMVPVLGRTDSAESMLLWTTLVGGPVLLVLAVPGWTPVRREDAGALLLLVLPGFVGQLALIEAFRRGAASVVAPFEYTALLWGMAIDWWLWRLSPDSRIVFGGSLVATAGIVLLVRERRRSKSSP